MAPTSRGSPLCAGSLPDGSVLDPPLCGVGLPDGSVLAPPLCGVGLPDGSVLDPAPVGASPAPVCRSWISWCLVLGAMKQ